MSSVANSPLIQLSGVSKVLRRQGATILDNISFQVMPGEVVCLIGPSGSGKSTCLRCIAGLDTITSGDIEVCGINYKTKAYAPHILRRKTAMIFQRFELFAHLTALENVALALKVVLKKSSQEARDTGFELLKRVGLQNHSHLYPRVLSGGQQQRVAIARALAVHPEVLLCDEPTSALDPELVIEVTDILQDLARSGMTMILVTHEMEFAAKMATKCLFLDHGKILETGRGADFFNRPSTQRLQQFLQVIHFKTPP